MNEPQNPSIHTVLVLPCDFDEFIFQRRPAAPEALKDSRKNRRAAGQ